MSFHEYILVGESDIYDKQGFRKAIFLQMAGLIQTKEKLEDGSPNPNVGWVVQTEKWIAERLGISESAVYKAIKKFLEDGWWVREELPRDFYGHRHCRWRLADDALERLQKAKRKEGPRVSNPKKANKGSFRPQGSGPMRNSDPRVNDASSASESLTPASLEALRLGADRRDGSDTEASRLGACNDVGLDVDSLLCDETNAIAMQTSLKINNRRQQGRPLRPPNLLLRNPKFPVLKMQSLRFLFGRASLFTPRTHPTIPAHSPP